ncbi:MAG: glycerophosphodiester phosphodiesterase family protein [Parvibaculaceae bacterium]
MWQVGDYGWLIGRPIAHRGLHDRAKGVIENTRSAFAAAISKGYAIECDLQLAGDGEAMVFHDDTLDRLTEGAGPLVARTAEDLRSVAIRGTADRMQTLDDLLAQVDGRVTLVIELKSHWHGSARLAERAVEVLADYSGPFALMSFDPDIVEAVRELAPSMTRGIVADRVADESYHALPFARRMELRSLSHLARTRPHFVSYHARGLPYPPLGPLRGHGVPIICWTIRSPKAASRALRYSDQITFEGFLP